MNVAAYLDRIAYSGLTDPTPANLRRMHRCHMRAVPFENLDVGLGNPIVLDLHVLFDKIVNRRRGGFCYEVNALFHWLLQELGYSAQIFSARVFSSGEVGPEFDHMLLAVDFGEIWLVDVGFGDSFQEPLLHITEPQTQFGQDYRLIEDGQNWILQKRSQGEKWKPQYTFTHRPRQVDDFNGMCRYHQTSPQSVFSQKSVCSLATNSGRMTLANTRFIVTRDGEREETRIEEASEYRSVLQQSFGIPLEPADNIAALMGEG